MDNQRKTKYVCNSIENKIQELKAKNPRFRIGESVGWVLMLTYK